ncbi:hypothetical protein AAG570_007381 [Ranatra chinensis]|uniref:DNAJC9 HTH domain-containing protein n=1 Tax=Ranatra chinensis TaxID=642074 RepID=A0ABD0XVP9_9HEMI
MGDVCEAYMRCQGRMDLIVEYVPFSSCDDEEDEAEAERLHWLIEALIESGQVPAYEAYLEWKRARYSHNANKRNRRRQRVRGESVSRKRARLDQRRETTIGVTSAERDDTTGGSASRVRGAGDAEAEADAVLADIQDGRQNSGV